MSASTRLIRTWLELLHLYWDNNTMTTTQSKKSPPPPIGELRYWSCRLYRRRDRELRYSSACMRPPRYDNNRYHNEGTWLEFGTVPRQLQCSLILLPSCRGCGQSPAVFPAGAISFCCSHFPTFSAVCQRQKDEAFLWMHKVANNMKWIRLFRLENAQGISKRIAIT